MWIDLRTIEHADQAYSTVGNWKIGDDGSILIEVSDMGNEDYAFLVAIHEAIEVWLCRKRGISQESVDAFDIDYEEKRLDGDFSEPGNDHAAPYFHEHQFATKIERQVADELGVEWDAYDSAVNSL